MTDPTLEWLLERLPADDLDERLAELDRKIAELENSRYVLRMARNARKLAAKAIDPSGPGMHPAANGHKPSIRDAIRYVFGEADGGPLTMDQIMAAIQDHDWMPEGDNPRRNINAAVSSLVHRAGELESTGQRATYRLVDTNKVDPANLNRLAGSQETAANRLFIGSGSGETGREGT